MRWQGRILTKLGQKGGKNGPDARAFPASPEAYYLLRAASGQICSAGRPEDDKKAAHGTDRVAASFVKSRAGMAGLPGLGRPNDAS